jgi:hypothetical protein
MKIALFFDIIGRYETFSEHGFPRLRFASDGIVDKFRVSGFRLVLAFLPLTPET